MLFILYIMWLTAILKAAVHAVNLCSIDLSKVFDKVDHWALFMKLMKRDVQLKLLDTLIFWLQKSWSCVKW